MSYLMLASLSVLFVAIFFCVALTVYALKLLTITKLKLKGKITEGFVSKVHHYPSRYRRFNKRFSNIDYTYRVASGDSYTRSAYVYKNKNYQDNAPLSISYFGSRPGVSCPTEELDANRLNRLLGLFIWLMLEFYLLSILVIGAISQI